MAIQLYIGAAAVVGHSFPVFLKFREGKGGATSMGINLFLMPKAIPSYFGIVAVTLLITRNLTFDYGVAFICVPLVGWLAYHSGILVAFSVALILFLGLSNISGIKEMRLKEGWRHAIFRTRLRDRR